MSIPFFIYSTFLIIIGTKKEGKTYLTKFLLKSLKRFIIIDSTWEFSDIGYIVHYPERIRPAFLEWHRVVYQPARGYDNQPAWDHVFRECRNLANYTLGINEIDQFTHGQWYISEHLKHIVRRGRIQGISIIGNTRRPSLFHLDIRNSADVIVCFRLHEKEELKYMSNWMNVEKDKIKTLQLHWSWMFITQGSKLQLLKPC